MIQQIGKIRKYTQVSEQDSKNLTWNNRLTTIVEKDEQAQKNINGKYKLTSTTHLQKWRILKTASWNS